MNWRYDRDADAAYLTLAAKAVASTREASEDVIVDYDADGRIVGIEVLHASQRLASGLLQPQAAE